MLLLQNLTREHSRVARRRSMLWLSQGKIEVKMDNKTAILNFVLTIIELVQGLLIITMYTKFEENPEKIPKFIAFTS